MTPDQTPDARQAWIDEVVREVAELPDRTSPDEWPEAMLVTADELRAILSASPPFSVIGSGYEAGFDAGYPKGFADGLDESAGDPRVERIEAGFKAIHAATNGEYSPEDMIVMDALQAARDYTVRLARRETHIQQLIDERDKAQPSPALDARAIAEQAKSLAGDIAQALLDDYDAKRNGAESCANITAILASALAAASAKEREAAFRAGFEWAINGTDKHGDYNGGSVEDGCAEWVRSMKWGSDGQ